MDTRTDTQLTTIIATRIPDGESKLEVLPRHFGRRMLLVEAAVYFFIRYLSSDYRGAYWHFYELTNGGFYMAPDINPLHLHVATNGYEGKMSADAAGITACLFALSHLSMRFPNETLSDHFHQLRDFALEHAESQEILAAID